MTYSDETQKLIEKYSKISFTPVNFEVKREGWEKLKFPLSGAGYNVDCKLKWEENKGWLPGHDYVTLPMQLIRPKDIRVVIFGQDPYPNPIHVTGIPFEVPDNIHWTKYPLTLRNIFREYCADTHFPYPPTGNLYPWIREGVFLWNVIPTCNPFVSLSHDWEEYLIFAKEIINLISLETGPTGGPIFVFLGARARVLADAVPDDFKDAILQYSHPSPRGAYAGKTPFMGSRLFSTINAMLCASGKKSINWKLSDCGVYGESHDQTKECDVKPVSSYNPHIPPSKDVWREEQLYNKPSPADSTPDT